jgi:hypothetical protein
LLKRLEDGRVIDSVTGEVMIEELIFRRNNEYVKVQQVKKKQDEQVEDKIAWKIGDHFVKLYIDNICAVVNSLTGTEVWIAMLLAQYIKPISNMVAINNNPVNNADIMIITGYKEQHVIDLMKSLVNKRIFSKNRVGRSNQYFANPFIFTRGNKINATLYDMFKNYKVPKVP